MKIELDPLKLADEYSKCRKNQHQFNEEIAVEQATSCWDTFGDQTGKFEKEKAATIAYYKERAEYWKGRADLIQELLRDVPEDYWKGQGQLFKTSGWFHPSGH